VHGANGDPAKLALLEAMISFASSTGAAVCGEGVEDLDDLRALADLDATYAQGFALARPAPPWPVLAPSVAATSADQLELGVRIAAGARVADSWAQRLADLADHFAAVEDLSDLVDAGPIVAALLGAEDVALMRPGGREDEMVELISQHPMYPAGTTWSLDDFPGTVHLLANRRIGQVVRGDANCDPAELAELELIGMGAMLIVPVPFAGGRSALMEVYRVRRQAFSRAEVNRARLVALQLQAVLDRLLRA
jgi:hypothetical protein